MNMCVCVCVCVCELFLLALTMPHIKGTKSPLRYHSDFITANFCIGILFQLFSVKEEVDCSNVYQSEGGGGSAQMPAPRVHYYKVKILPAKSCLLHGGLMVIIV